MVRAYTVKSHQGLADRAALWFAGTGSLRDQRGQPLASPKVLPGICQLACLTTVARLKPSPGGRPRIPHARRPRRRTREAPGLSFPGLFGRQTRGLRGRPTTRHSWVTAPPCWPHWNPWPLSDVPRGCILRATRVVHPSPITSTNDLNMLPYHKTGPSPSSQVDRLRSQASRLCGGYMVGIMLPNRPPKRKPRGQHPNNALSPAFVRNVSEAGRSEKGGFVDHFRATPQGHGYLTPARARAKA